MLIGRLLQAFPPAPSWGCRSIWPRSPPRAAKAFTPAGSRAVSRLPSWWQPRWALPQRGTGAERYQRLGLAYSVPFGCLIVPFIFILRRKLEETRSLLPPPSSGDAPVFATLLANWQVVIAGMMMVAMTTTAFYLITVYAPTFGGADAQRL